MTLAGGVRVVTDSLAWIPPEMAREQGITVVPLHISIEGDHYTETVDLTNEEFYRRLRVAKEMPKTSQPSAGEFLEVYRSIGQTAGAIISIHASSRLSGTFRSAETAAAMFRQERPDVPVEVLDTLQAAPAEGIVAIQAAEAAAAGASFEQIVAAAQTLIPKPRILLAVETLEFLHKGGRIGRAQALLGGLLHVRPILTVQDGEVAPKERVRTRAKAIERIVALMGEYAQARRFGHVAILHAAAPDSAQELAEAVKQRFQVDRFIFSEIGPVIGTYVGPGAFAATFHCE